MDEILYQGTEALRDAETKRVIHITPAIRPTYGSPLTDQLCGKGMNMAVQAELTSLSNDQLLLLRWGI